MPSAALEEIASSKSRLLLADLISTRPRTLAELAKATGISPPGVLKHLGILERLGVVEEAPFEGGPLSARKVYRLKGRPVKNFSGDGALVVRESPASRTQARSDDPLRELQTISTDLILERRRIREQVRKLARGADRLAESEARLNALVDGLGLSDLDGFLVRAAFTEESLEDAEAYMRDTMGLPDARTALDRALRKARRVG